MSRWTAANRLQNADGPWGAKTFYYDGVGNRTTHILTPPGGSASTEVLGYGATHNRLEDITVASTTVRTFAYDAAGNITTDTRSGSVYAYTYNHAGRLKPIPDPDPGTVSLDGTLKATYTYNGQHQLIVRVITNSDALNGTTHFVHDRMGNVIAEADSSGNTLREVLWLPETQACPGLDPGSGPPGRPGRRSTCRWPSSTTSPARQ